MANIDVVNEDDEVIGVASYTEVTQQKLRHRIARIFLFDSEGRLYLQQRSMSMPTAPGLWDQSAAGHVDEGESYEVAAARELQEELGLKNLILNQKVKYYEEEPHPHYGVLKRFNILYTAQYDGQEIILDPEEVMGGRWITTPDLEEWMSDKSEELADGFKSAYKKYKEAK